MIQLPLLFEDPTPTPDQRNARQLVEIQEYLHVWNARERAMRLAQLGTDQAAIRAASPSRQLPPRS